VDAGPDAGGPESGSADAGAGGCAVQKRWASSFDSDPTVIDADNDGALDWVVRGAGAFDVAELASGVWRSATPIALDSRPLDDFGTRLEVDVRFRSLSVSAGGRGAIFWINLNQARPLFSALFASVLRQSAGGQVLTLFGKVGTAEIPLAVFADLPEDFIDLHLDVDPVALAVAVRIDGVDRGVYSIPETEPPNADRFATLVSLQGTSEFDAIDLRICAP
jgi:hypothetical protein